jgi:lysophospholipase L1-like esterase
MKVSLLGPDGHPLTPMSLDDDTMLVQPLAPGKFRCLESTDIFDDYAIFWGDEFEAEQLDDHTLKILAALPTNSMSHWYFDQGMNIYSGPPEQHAANYDYHELKQNIFDAVESAGGKLEYGDALFSHFLMLSAPLEKLASIVAIMQENCTNYWQLSHATPCFPGNNNILEDEPERPSMSFFYHRKHPEKNLTPDTQTNTVEKAPISVVLAGDSIFDNQKYVPDGQPVSVHLDHRLPSHCHVQLIAEDGSICLDIERQLSALDSMPDFLVISTGGNDALRAKDVLANPCHSVYEALGALHKLQEKFRQDYRAMLRKATKASQKIVVCTIYDAVPDLDSRLTAALSLFNDVIVKEANLASITVIDLRVVCSDPGDYSLVSSIEPSDTGGEKIARAIADWVRQTSDDEK